MRIFFVTCPPATAESLVRTLLAERLIACANILTSVRSLYSWKGSLCDEPEEILLMETSDARAQQAMARIQQLHPYEVPKIVTLDPAEVSSAYAHWVQNETTPAPKGA